MLGGSSCERDVSLRSGAAVAEALRYLGYQVVELDPVDGKFKLSSDIDLVFLALQVWPKMVPYWNFMPQRYALVNR